MLPVGLGRNTQARPAKGSLAVMDELMEHDDVACGTFHANLGFLPNGQVTGCIPLANSFSNTSVISPYLCTDMMPISTLRCPTNDAVCVTNGNDARDMGVVPGHDARRRPELGRPLHAPALALTTAPTGKPGPAATTSAS